MAIQSINPYTYEVLKEYDEDSTEQVHSKIEKANNTFRILREKTFAERSEMMKKAAEVLRQNKEHYASIISKEMGKVISESVKEIDKCAWVCDYYADNAENFLKEEPLNVEDGEAYITYDPLGVILAVMPWNFPFWQVFRFAAPNLMAGNTGLLKHASNVPQCAYAIEEVFRKAGFPDGSFQALMISTGKVNEVLDHPMVKAATLTGSDRAGSKVAERAGKNLKKTVLELGGSDPFIILSDADLKEAAKTAAKARMINCGQSCIAAKRFIVVEEVADQFIDLFKENLKNLKHGDPMNESADYGPMARKDLAKDLEEQVKTSLDKGAELILGSGKVENDEITFHPTIITNIKPGMPAYDEELFGPVAILFVAKNEDDAIRIANDSPFGLGGALWTSNKEKGRKLARKIETGTVFINGMVASNPKTPFGGIKTSGYGRELSEVGIKEFMNIKTVWIK